MATQLRGSAGPAAQWWHEHLIPATAAPRDLRAVLELELPGEADPNLGQPLAVAADGQAALREPGIGLDERILD